jgi:hypothetical protein
VADCRPKRAANANYVFAVHANTNVKRSDANFSDLVEPLGRYRAAAGFFFDPANAQPVQLSCDATRRYTRERDC